MPRMRRRTAAQGAGVVSMMCLESIGTSVSRLPRQVRPDTGARTRSCAELKGMCLRLAHDFARGLVVAEALKRRLAERALEGPFRELDLADQEGFDPDGPGAAGTRAPLVLE